MMRGNVGQVLAVSFCVTGISLCEQMAHLRFKFAELIPTRISKRVPTRISKRVRVDEDKRKRFDRQSM